jgi:hypothetical protein
MTKAIIISRLLLMGLLLLVKWLMEPLYFVFLLLYSFFESIVSGTKQAIAYLQKLNNELITKAK